MGYQVLAFVIGTLVFGGALLLAVHTIRRYGYWCLIRTSRSHLEAPPIGE
jgi:hypothetical protein